MSVYRVEKRSNIALLNAMGMSLLEENLYDKALSPAVPKVLKSTDVEGYTPESVEETGVSAQEIPLTGGADTYASAKAQRSCGYGRHPVLIRVWKPCVH